MRTHLVVVLAPDGDDRSRMLKRDEPVFVQALVPELAVEALHIGVLRGFPRLREHQRHAVGSRPLVKRPAGELGPLIGPDRLGIAAEAAGRVQDVSNVLAVDPSADGNFHCFLGAVVHHRQALDRAPVGQGVEDEVHRPGVVGPRRQLQRTALDGHAIALAALAHRQASVAVQPVDPLVVGDPALPFQQDVQPSVAEPATFARQRNEPGLQRRVRHARLVVQHAA